jgi:hypothetical protein
VGWESSDKVRTAAREGQMGSRGYYKAEILLPSREHTAIDVDEARRGAFMVRIISQVGKGTGVRRAASCHY